MNTKISDPCEEIVAAALDTAGVSYRRDDPLDFECDDLGIAIEVKQFFAPRIIDQIRDRPNVIVIQGRGAAIQFASLITAARAGQGQRKGAGDG